MLNLYTIFHNEYIMREISGRHCRDIYLYVIIFFSFTVKTLIILEFVFSLLGLCAVFLFEQAINSSRQRVSFLLNLKYHVYLYFHTHHRDTDIQFLG